MPRLLLFLILVAVAVIVYALIDCIMTKAHSVRSISKPAWIAAIVLVPLLGAGLWFLFGRPRPSGTRGRQRPAPRHPTAPDDDPQFLRNLEAKRRQEAREKENRRKERELRAEQEKKAREDQQKKDGEADNEPGGKTA
ncbi:PLD nuclease N-terminal domain-containing protein [Arthrobacter sp. CAN_A1]|uniref:PLD nuclease N-terminal domain-containing protein n=1 Tax=Arthrobacter sp. CAN_A1 TaxID=2787717 RepID=UPI0018C92933